MAKPSFRRSLCTPSIARLTPAATRGAGPVPHWWGPCQLSWQSTHHAPPWLHLARLRGGGPPPGQSQQLRRGPPVVLKSPSPLVPPLPSSSSSSLASFGITATPPPSVPCQRHRLFAADLPLLWLWQAPRTSCHLSLFPRFERPDSPAVLPSSN